jgi:hypothetical protein
MDFSTVAQVKWNRDLQNRNNEKNSVKEELFANLAKIAS